MRVKNIVYCAVMLRLREKALRRWEETKQRPNCLRGQHFTFEKETLVKCCLMVPIDIRFICKKRHSACWVVSAIIFGRVNVASPSPYCYRRKYLECRMVYVSLNTKEAIYTDIFQTSGFDHCQVGELLFRHFIGSYKKWCHFFIPAFRSYLIVVLVAEQHQHHGGIKTLKPM